LKPDGVVLIDEVLHLHIAARRQSYGARLLLGQQVDAAA
jgi:hypothetical protein